MSKAVHVKPGWARAMLRLGHNTMEIAAIIQEAADRDRDWRGTKITEADVWNALARSDNDRSAAA